MSPITRFASIALIIASSSSALGAEFDAASYHDDQCTRCHGTKVYTRENRRVRSYPMLEAQVARCDANLATKLFPEDLSLLVEHLNDNFYKFAK